MSKSETESAPIDENTAIEVSDFVGGSFVYALFEFVNRAELDTEPITQHLESLYDSENHYGISVARGCVRSFFTPRIL